MYFGMPYEIDPDSEDAKRLSKTTPISYGLGYPTDDPTGKLVDNEYDYLILDKAFSCIAIDRLSERLFGKKERITKKLVYLCSVPVYMGWLVVDGICGNGKAVTVSSDPMVDLESSFQPKLWELTCYGCAVWDSSKIIIAGGKRGDGVPSNEVFIHDTVSKTWNPHLPMKVTRGENPTVVVADSKVFVFGGVQEFYPHYESWAEFYDFSDLGSGSWDFLPHCPLSIASPSDSPTLIPKIISHAVHLNGNQILLWLSPGAVLSFNYRDSSWKRYDDPMSIAVGPSCCSPGSSTVVVFEDFLFWHNHRTLYARDLLSDVTIPMYTLPRNGFSNVNFSGGDVPPPRFLVHIGRGKLCLFYLVDKRICYITFWLQISQGGGPPAPHVVIGTSGFLETPSVTVINHALEISS